MWTRFYAQVLLLLLLSNLVASSPSSTGQGNAGPARESSNDDETLRSALANESDAGGLRRSISLPALVSRMQNDPPQLVPVESPPLQRGNLRIPRYSENGATGVNLPCGAIRGIDYQLGIRVRSSDLELQPGRYTLSWRWMYAPPASQSTPALGYTTRMTLANADTGKIGENIYVILVIVRRFGARTRGITFGNFPNTRGQRSFEIFEADRAGHIFVDLFDSRVHLVQIGQSQTSFVDAAIIWWIDPA